MNLARWATDAWGPWISAGWERNASCSTSRRSGPAVLTTATSTTPTNACRKCARNSSPATFPAPAASSSKSFRYADGVSGWGDVNQFGCYQTLGDLIVDFDNSPEAKLSSPSGHAAGDGNGIENTVDGNPGSKWCVNNGSTPVSWQMQLPAAQTVTSYAFTSGDDVPDRDPRSWVLEGSADGKTWVEVDRHALDKPFEKRHQTKTFEIAHPACVPVLSFHVRAHAGKNLPGSGDHPRRRRRSRRPRGW